MFEHPAIYFLPTRDMLLYVETTQYELETRKHVREPIKKGGDAT